MTTRVVADLDVDVVVGRRTARARLSGGPGELVLDVDDVGVLLSGLPSSVGPRRSRRLPDGLGEQLSGASVLVVSRQHRLAVAHVGARGDVVVRPTARGVVAVATAVAGPRTRAAVTALAAAGVVAAVVAVVRRGRPA